MASFGGYPKSTTRPGSGAADGHWVGTGVSWGKRAIPSAPLFQGRGPQTAASLFLLLNWAWSGWGSAGAVVLGGGSSQEPTPQGCWVPFSNVWKGKGFWGQRPLLGPAPGATHCSFSERMRPGKDREEHPRCLQSPLPVGRTASCLSSSPAGAVAEAVTAQVSLGSALGNASRNQVSSAGRVTRSGLGPQVRKIRGQPEERSSLGARQGLVCSPPQLRRAFTFSRGCETRN